MERDYKVKVTGGGISSSPRRGGDALREARRPVATLVNWISSGEEEGSNWEDEEEEEEERGVEWRGGGRRGASHLGVRLSAQL